MPITLPIATLIGSAVAGGTTIAGMRTQRDQNRRAMNIEERTTQDALREAREQRDYERRLESERIAREIEDRNYSRSQLDREYGYRSGRDAVEDARFNDERDYSRGQFADYKARLTPFADVGSRAMANLGSVVGRQLPTAVPTAGNGALVRLQSPSGDVREVPAGQLNHWLAKGAKQV